jgi:hypothetical protein
VVSTHTRKILTRIRMGTTGQVCSEKISVKFFAIAYLELLPGFCQFFKDFLKFFYGFLRVFWICFMEFESFLQVF